MNNQLFKTNDYYLIDLGSDVILCVPIRDTPPEIILFVQALVARFPHLAEEIYHHLEDFAAHDQTEQDLVCRGHRSIRTRQDETAR